MPTGNLVSGAVGNKNTALSLGMAAQLTSSR